MNKQFILSSTYFIFLTVQIITITFLEGEIIAHDKPKYLSADPECLTLYGQMLHVWSRRRTATAQFLIWETKTE